MEALVSLLFPMTMGHLTCTRGCVTPKILENMKKESAEDMDLIDGLQDLPEEEQNKVIDAIANGHVDDADWKGVSRRLQPSLCLQLTINRM